MTDINVTDNVSTTTQLSKEGIILNSKIADSSSKIIFDDPILYSQFLRDYIDLPYFKDVQPEDIEDVSEQYVPLFAEERNADRVKKVKIKNEPPFFLISLIEHKSKVDYNVIMQIFRYMVYIWEAYAKEAEKIQKGVTKLVDFKYPPILPIVYYEGSDNWTVPMNFRSRIMQGNSFEKYIPDFEYYLVPLHNYSNEELLEKKDEILKDTPNHILDIISNILRVFLLKMNLPDEDAEELVGKVKEKKMGYLFENMEKMDIQAERRNTAEQRERAEKAEERANRAEEKGIRILIETYQEMGVSKEDTVQKVIEKYDLSQICANEKMSLYWKE